jgi:peptide/nickel transport system permease protein
MRTLGGAELTGLAYYADIAWHLFLPALTLGIHQLALITRLTRASMLEELGQDYVRTARSKGLSENVVLLRHALKNALLPVITLVGMNAGRIIGGAVLTETVFSWPGVGLLTYEAIASRDYPLLMGTFVIISMSVFLGNLIADIVTFYADPRIRSI